MSTPRAGCSGAPSGSSTTTISKDRHRHRRVWHQPAGAGKCPDDSEEETVDRSVRNGRVQLSESPEFNTKSKSAFRYLPSLLGLRASCGLWPAHGSPALWGSSLK